MSEPVKPFVPCVVDNRRPSVAWVSVLPKEWLPGNQALVLWVLACDAFENESAPSGEVLQRWTKLSRTVLYEALSGLRRGIPGVRPALIERLDRNGNPIPEEASPGRGRTHYRLRTDVLPAALTVGEGSEHPDGSKAITPSKQSDRPDPSGEEQSDRPDPSGEPADSEQSGRPDPFEAKQSGNSPGIVRTSGHALALTLTNSSPLVTKTGPTDEFRRRREAMKIRGRGPGTDSGTAAE